MCDPCPLLSILLPSPPQSLSLPLSPSVDCSSLARPSTRTHFSLVPSPTLPFPSSFRRQLPSPSPSLFGTLTLLAQGASGSGPYHGHEHIAKLCGRFVSHLFTCPDVPPPPVPPSTTPSPTLCLSMHPPSPSRSFSLCLMLPLLLLLAPPMPPLPPSLSLALPSPLPLPLSTSSPSMLPLPPSRAPSASPPRLALSLPHAPSPKGSSSHC
jgi:hypothetical protein